MYLKRLALLLPLGFLFGTACELVTASNAFDPEAPKEIQARAALTGRIVLLGPDGADIRLRSMESVRVGLLDENGRELSREGLPLARKLIDMDAEEEEGKASGRFVIEDLNAGQYTLLVEGLSDLYTRPPTRLLTLAPGMSLDVGDLVFVYDGGNPGRIEGEIAAEGAALSQHQVTLYRLQDGRIEEAGRALTEGAFAFSSLPLGTYAVVVESDGYAPSYRLDVKVDDSEEANLQYSFSGETQIALAPVTAVLLPTPTPETVVDEGLIYTRSNQMPLAVFSIGRENVGVTKMRLGTNPELRDENGDELPFVPYEAATQVRLPEREGPITIYAQFKAESAANGPDATTTEDGTSAAQGFEFVSPVFTLEVTRDITPPQLLDAVVAGSDRDETGRFLSQDDSLLLRIDATDVISAVDAVGVRIGDSAPDVLEDRTGPSGRVLLEEELTAEADGEADIWIVLEDRAGNRSAPASIAVLVDSTAPDVAIRIENEVGGILSTRFAQVSFDESGATSDLPVAMQLRVLGSAYAEIMPYAATEWFIPPELASDGENVVIEAKLYDQVGNTSVVTQEVTLELRGSVVGAIAPEGIPLITPDASGAQVLLLNEAGDTLQEMTTDAAGTFGFDGIVEGKGYQIKLDLPGYRSAEVRDIEIFAPASDGLPVVTRLPALSLALLRGDVSGQVRLSDLVQDDTAHAGIIVSAHLAGPEGRTFGASTVTDASGAFVFREVPATRENETIRIEARRQDYGVVNFETQVEPNRLNEVDAQTLARNRGDFDLCLPAGDCVPVAYFNTDSLRVRLRDPSDVRTLWVSINGAAAVSLPWSADNRTSFSLENIEDGEVEVSIQLEKEDDSMSAPLTALVVKDTQAPTDASLRLVGNDVALANGFTNRVFVDVDIEANAGTGKVAPLSAPRFVIEDTEPTSFPADANPCEAMANCRVRLPGADIDAVEEKRHHVWAYACDVAGNCSEPASVSVVYDKSPPSAGNGASFRLVAEGSYLDESGAETVTVVPSYAYGAEISLGSAKTGSGASVLDEGAEAVADVYGFRLALSEAGLARANIQTFTEPPIAGAVRGGGEITVPALPTGAATRRVYVQFIDAAGNASDLVEALIRVDNEPPQVVLVINGGAPTAELAVPFGISVPTGAEAPSELEFRVNDGDTQVFQMPLDGSERLVLSADAANAGDGEYRVKLRAKDRSGNATQIERTLLLDRTGPVIDEVRCASFTCQLNENGLLTRSENARIQVRVDARDALTQVSQYGVRVGALPALTLSAAGTLDIELQANQSQEVELTPYDSVGNAGAPFVVAVTHDDIGPVISEMLIDGGESHTRDPRVQVRVVVENNDAVGVRYASSESFSGPFAPFAIDSFLALPSPDGTKDICVQVQDQAGNTSFRCESIVLDRVAPVGSLSLPGGQQSDGSSVEVELAYANDTAELAVSIEALDCANEEDAYQNAIGSPQRLQVALRSVEGPQTIYACFRDLAGNVSAASGVVYVDATAPNASLEIDGGALYTRDADVLAIVSANENVVSSAWSVNETLDCTSATYETHVSSQSIGLNGGDGVYTVSVCVQDAVGNRSASPAVARITLDSQAPVIAEFSLADGDGHTATSQVSTRTLIQDNDAIEARFSTSLSFADAYAPYRERDLVTLTGADGEKQVCVQVRDLAGNEASACDEIVLDTSAPVGTLALPNGNVTAATTIDVQLTYPATDTARVALSFTALSCNSSTVEYVTATGSPQLLQVQSDSGEGPRTLYACFQDAAGNASAASISITLDRTAPEVSIVVEDGALYALNEDVSVALSASPDTTGMALLAGVLDCERATYIPFSANTTLSLPRSEITHRVSVCVEDAVGNKSAAPATTSIVLDLSPPSGTLVLDGGAAYTKDVELGVVATRSDVGVTEMALFEGAKDCAQVTEYTAFQASNTFRISGSQGEVLVTACLRDRAGRVGALTDTIVYDSLAPTGTLVLNDGQDTTALPNINAALTFSSDVVGVKLSATPISCEFAQFEDPFILGEVTLTNVGVNTVTACLKDAAGNIASLSEYINYQNAGDGTLVVYINGGAASTNVSDVKVNVTLPSVDFTKWRVAESEVNALDCDDLNAYTDFDPKGATITLSSGDAPAEGYRTVSVCVWNGSLGEPETQRASDTIFLDTYAPSGSVEIDAGANVTNASAVTLSLSNDYSVDGEVVSVALSSSSSLVGGQCTGSFEAFQSVKTFPVSGLDGEKTIYVCLRDVAGNTREVSDSILLDRSPPSPVALSVDPLVQSSEVLVTLTFPNETEEFAIAEGALDCASTALYQTPPAGNPATTQVVLSAVDGPHSLIACFRDGAGNASQATALTTLDRSPPTGSVVLNDGASFTTSRNITVTLQGGADATGMARVESTDAPDCSTQSYEAFVSQTPFTLSSIGDGQKTVHVCLQDEAGNTGLAIPASIWLDESAPNGLLSIQDGQIATRQRNVLVSIDSQGNADVSSYAVAEGSIACNATNLVYSPFAETVSFYLSANDGEKTLYLCLQDEAGNVSDVAATASITLDTAAPVVLADALQIQDGDGYLQDENNVDVVFTWSVAGDVASVKLAEENIDCAAAGGYVDVPADSTAYTWSGFAISATTGTKRLLGCFRDIAGNTTLVSDTSLRDSEDPSGTLVLNAGDVYATDPSGSIEGLLRASADVVRFAWQETSETNATCSQASINCSTQNYEDFAGELIAGQRLRSLSMTLSGTPLTGGKKCIEVCFEDAAGNRSVAPAFDDILLDADAPTLDFTLRRKQSDSLDASLDTVVTPVRDIELVFTSVASDAVSIAIAEGTLDCAQASFEALPAPLPQSFSRTFILANGSDGMRTVSVCMRDSAGNASGNLGLARSIELDTTPPNVQVALAGGGAYTTSLSLQANVSVTPSSDLLARAELVDSSEACDSATYASFSIQPSTVSFSFGAGDGERRQAFCFRDRAGNVTKVSDSIIIDTDAPQAVLTVEEGRAYVTSTSVGLNWSDVSNDVFEMKISENEITDCATETGFGAYVASLPFVLTNLDGTHTLYACVKDKAGNVSDVITTSVILDTVDPAIAFSVSSSADGAVVGYTSVRSVELGVSSLSADVGSFSYTEGPLDCTTASYQDRVDGILPLVLASGSDGTRTISFCVKDAAGRTNGATGLTRTIELDTTPPQVSIQVAGGAAYALGTRVSIDIAAVPSNDALTYLVLSDANADCVLSELPTSFAALPASISGLELPSLDGVQQVGICFRDRAGNLAKASDSILLDTQVPQATLLVDGGAAYATSPSVTLSWENVSSDVAEMKVTETVVTDCAAESGYTSFAPSSPYALSAGEGAHTLYACVKDNAGHFSDVVTATIMLDSVDPEIFFTVASSADGAAVGFTPTRSVELAVSSISEDVVSFAYAEGTLDCASAAYQDRAEGILPLVLASGSDGTRTVSFCVKDLAGRTNGATGISRTMELDTTPPQVAIQVENSATYTRTATVSVALAVTPSSDALSRYVLEDSSADCVLSDLPTTYEVQPSLLENVSLENVNGAQKVGVCFRDAAGNVAKAVDTIVLDTESPSATLVINAGAQYTTSSSVTLRAENMSTDVQSIWLSQDGASSCDAGETYQPFTGSTPFEIVGDDGAYTLTACLKDAAGNVSRPLTASIQLDTKDPAVAVNLLSTNEHSETGYTNTRYIQILIEDLEGDVASIAYGEGVLDCESATYQAYGDDTLAFTLAPGSDGTRTVGVCVRDYAGRKNGATGRTDTIELDTTPPDVAVSVAGGLAVTNQTSDVEVFLTASPSNDVLRYQVSSSCSADGNWAGAFGALPSNILVDFRNLSGTKNVAICFRDQAGNIATYADDIELDVERPSMGGFSCADCNVVDGTWYTNEDVVQLIPEIYSVDVERVWTVVYAPGQGEGRDTRACETDGDCRSGIEKCTAGLIPSMSVCAQGHSDLQNILVDLARNAGDGFNGLNPQGEGRQRIDLYLQDVAGNLSSDDTGNDGNLSGKRWNPLWRDTTPPTVSFTLPPFSNEQVVFIRRINATDTPNRDVTPYSNHATGLIVASALSTFADVNPIPFSSTLADGDLPVTLSAGDGLKTVYVKLSDYAGNEVTAQKSITLDSTPPTAPRFSNSSAIVGPAGGDRQYLELYPLSLPAVDENLRAPNPYILRGILTDDCPRLTGGKAISIDDAAAAGGDDGCTWDGATQVTLQATDFPLRIGNSSDGEHRLLVSARDMAGNESARDVVPVLVDTLDPQKPTLRDVNERDASVTLVWDRIQGSGTEDVVGYMLYYGEDDASYLSADFANEGASPIFIPQPAFGDEVQFTLSGLTNDSPFLFQLKTIDVADNESVAHYQNAQGATDLAVRREALPNPIAPEWRGLLDEIFIADRQHGGTLDFKMAVQGPRAAAMSIAPAEVGETKPKMQVCVYDVADATDMKKLNCSYGLTNNESVVLHGRLAYTMGDDGLSYLDISNPGGLAAANLVPNPISRVLNPDSQVERVDHLNFVGKYALASRGAELLSLAQTLPDGRLDLKKNEQPIVPTMRAVLDVTGLKWALDDALPANGEGDVLVRYSEGGVVKTEEANLTLIRQETAGDIVQLFGTGLPTAASSVVMVEFLNATPAYSIAALGASTRFVAVAASTGATESDDHRLLVYRYDPNNGNIEIAIQADTDGQMGLSLESKVHDVIVESAYTESADEAARVITCGDDGVTLFDVQLTEGSGDVLPSLTLSPLSSIGVSCSEMTLSASTLIFTQRDRFDETYVFLYDISDPLMPRPVGRILGTKLKGSVSSIALDGAMLYTLSNGTGNEKQLNAFQLTEPERMALEGRNGGLTESFSDLQVDGATVYVAGKGIAYAIDVSSPVLPQRYSSSFSAAERLGRSDYASMSMVGRTPAVAFMGTAYPYITFDTGSNATAPSRPSSGPCAQEVGLQTSALQTWGSLVIVTTKHQDDPANPDRVEIWDLARDDANQEVLCAASLTIEDDNYLEEISDVVDGRFYVNSGSGQIHGFQIAPSPSLPGVLSIRGDKPSAGTLTIDVEGTSFAVAIADRDLIPAIATKLRNTTGLLDVLTVVEIGADATASIQLERKVAGYTNGDATTALTATFTGAALTIETVQTPANPGEAGVELTHLGTSDEEDLPPITLSSLNVGDLVNRGDKLLFSRMGAYTKSTDGYVLDKEGGLFELDINPASVTFLDVNPDRVYEGSFGAMSWGGRRAVHGRQHEWLLRPALGCGHFWHRL